MVVQQWHYWKKVSFDQKKSTSGRGLKSWKLRKQLLFTYIQADTHDIWTQLLILRRNEADAQKYLHSTLIAYQRVERTSKKVQDTFCLSAFFTATSLSPTTTKKNSISTILLSLSLFCLFVTQKPFLLPFPRSSFECFYRSGNTSKNYTHFSCALAMSLPSPGHALRIRSTAPILDWISTRLFRMPTWRETERHGVDPDERYLFARFFLFFYVGGKVYQ